MTIRARIISWAWRARMPLTALAVLASVTAGAWASLATRKASRVTFTLRAAPGSAQIAAGSSATFRITIRRSNVAGPVSLRILRGLPRGAHAQLAPGRTRRSRSTLTIATTKRTRAGNYRLLVRAASGRLRRTLGLTLKVRAAKSAAAPVAPAPTAPTTPATQGVPFSVTGNLTGLEPGQPRPLNLSLSNPNSTSLSVASLNVSIRSVTAPFATTALPCTPADFLVTQFSGSYPVAVPASTTRSLADLGIPSAQWPQVSIVDRPNDQDGCKGATVTLSYGGTGTGG
jgi:hypothetical protein